jgi:hypothetical protein
MSNENAITEAVKLMNASLANMEAALTIIEYSISNNMPIPTLAKVTVKESCEDIQTSCEYLSKIVDE